MTTYRATLDLTAVELFELKATLILDMEKLRESANVLAAHASVVAGIERQRRTLGIVLRQLRTATINDNDGGPVGSCRYAIR